MAFKLLEPGRKITVARVTDPVRYQCDKSKAPQILFLTDWAKSLGIEPKAKVNVMIGEGEDKGFMVVRAEKDGKWSIGHPGQTKRQVCLKSKNMPFLGLHPPIACNAELLTDNNGTDYVKIQLPTSQQVRDAQEAKKAKGKGRETQTLTQKNVGVVDRRSLDTGRSL